MKTSGLPLSNCKTIVDFFKGMYDILEAHRWAVAEHKLLHRDISHANIVFESEDGCDIQEFSGARRRPVFINKILHGKLGPMARLLDMDNCANLDKSKLTPEGGKEDSDKPLRYRTGTPKFIARSVAAGQIRNVPSEMTPMPELQSEIEATYKRIHPDDASKLRTFSDTNGTTHGGHLSLERRKRYKTNPSLPVADFEHQPFHDAESVYWCIVVFVLLATPLNSDVDVNSERLSDVWTCIAEHEVGTMDMDKRSPIISENAWTKWLHKDLLFIAEFMDDLTCQIQPEWALLDPAPDPLHLHEAMQRLILQHVYDWEKNDINVELDAIHSRTFMRVRRTLLAPVNRYPINGQIIITSSTLGKRGSNSSARGGQSGSKRLREVGNDEPLQRAWVDSHAALVAPEALGYGSENTSG